MGKTVRQRKMNTALLTGFAIILFVVIAITLFSYMIIRRAQTNLILLGETNLQEVIHAYDVSLAIEEIQSNLREIMLEKDENRPHEITHSIDIITKSELSVRNNIEHWQAAMKYEMTLSDGAAAQEEAEQLEQTKSVSHEIINYLEVVDRFLLLYKNQNEKETDAMFENKIEPAHRALKDKINAVLDESKEEIVSDVHDINLEIKDIILAGFILILSVFLISLTLGYYLSRKIANKLLSYIEKIKLGEGKLVHMARHDVLTDLPNRLLFNEELARIIAKAKRHNEIFALLVIDIDHFKSINDTYGHKIGDLLLKEIASRMNDSVRAESIVARFGGDEFIIILTGLKEPQDAGIIAKQLLDKLNKPYMLNNQRINTSVSIGIANYPVSAETAEELIKSADVAMYHAKDLGRDNYQFFTSAIGDEHKKKLQLKNHLRDAIDNNELYLEYQPLYSSSGKQMKGMEALLRWNNPELGNVYPEFFIPLAEEYGFIMRIGEWVLRRACKEFSDIKSHAQIPLKLSVNVSAYQLIDGFVDLLAGILKENHLNPEDIEIELTETAVMASLIGSEQVMIEIQKLGVSIAIDDFGTGYSSLSRLKELPINTLKIDRSFIQGLSGNSNDSMIVSSILGLAKNLHIHAVAEGVETKQQLDFLNEHNAPDVQGFYFSESVSAEQIKKLIAKSE